MTTGSDPKEYPSSSPKPSVTIKGQAGKQIKIEAVSLQILSGKEGIGNTMTVAINGVAWAVWIYKSTKYSGVLTYNTYPHIVDAGKDAVISWTLEPSNSKYPAKFKNISYTYSFVDAVATGDSTSETDEYIIIKCAAGESAALITQLKAIAPKAEIGTVSKV